jgi:hypothetical protein
MLAQMLQRSFTIDTKPSSGFNKPLELALVSFFGLGFSFPVFATMKKSADFSKFLHIRGDSCADDFDGPFDSHDMNVWGENVDPIAAYISACSAAII